MNMGKKITELTESSTISGESSYAVSMGDGTGVKQVKHKKLVSQLISDMEMPYEETLAMLMETDENEVQKIPNLKAISDWIASKIANNLLATEEGFFLDARLGPVIDNRFKTVENKVTQINSDLKKEKKCAAIFETGILGIISVTIEAPTPNFPCIPYITTTAGTIGLIAYTTLENAKKYTNFKFHLIYKNSGNALQSCFIEKQIGVEEWLQLL